MIFALLEMVVGLIRNALLTPYALLLTVLLTTFIMVVVNRFNPQIFGNLNTPLRMFKTFFANPIHCAKLL